MKYFIVFIGLFLSVFGTSNTPPPHCPMIVDIVVSRVGCTPLDNQIVVTPTLGIAPYYYSIDNGTTFQTDSIFDNLVPGYYTVLVKDSDPDTCTGGSIVYVPDVLQLDSLKVDSACYSNSGRIKISVSEGQSNYQYSIDGGVNYVPNNNLFQNLAAGTYNIKIRDVNNCEIDTTVQIGLYPEITPVIDTQSIVCNTGINKGIVSATIPGNDYYNFSLDGGFNYSYEMDFADSTLTPGNYQLDIVDQYSCRYVYNFTITEQRIDDSVKLLNEFCSNVDGSIELFGFLGQAPYQYSIDGGSTYASSGLFSSLPAGTYYTEVMDDIGCKSFDTLKITNFGGVDVTIIGDDTLCNGNSTSIAAVHNAGQNVTYTWNNGLLGLQSHVVNPTTSVNYFVTVEDQYGCSDTASKFLFVEQQPTLSVTPTNVLACLGDTITVAASGARTYRWYNGDTNAILNVQIAGNANITVVGNNGFCYDSKTVTVQLRPLPTVVASSNKVTAQTGEYIAFSSAGSTSSSYLWNFGDGQTSPVSGPQHFFYNPGVYYVTLTGTMGPCSLKDTLVITITGNPVGVNEIGQEKLIQIYPNPSSGDNLAIETPFKASLSVINMEGKVLQVYPINEGSNSLNGLQIPKGVYTFRFTGEYVVNKRVIIE